MATAYEIAKQLKQKEKEEQEKEASAAAQRAAYRDNRKQEMRDWIEATLGSFGLPVVKQWHGGADRWVINKDGNNICACVLSYERGTYDASDDCRGIPYEGYEITVTRGGWGEIHSNDSVMAGITSEDSLNKYVAQVMKDHI